MGLGIESVSVTNFQSHTETRLELAGDGCLTVIVGPTDSGKTSIVRALKWVMYNQPAGTGFIRAGTAKCSVSIGLTSGVRVTRLRSVSRNQYTLLSQKGNHDSGEQVFEGFGTSVPAEVQRVLGVHPVPVGDLALTVNLAEQLDGPFLGGGIPSTLRAKALGRLAGSEVLDTASKSLGVDLHRASRERERLQRELESVGREIDRHSWVISVSDRIQSVEALVSGTSEKVKVVSSCRALVRELTGLPEPQVLFRRIAAIRSALSRAQTLDKHLSHAIEKLDRLVHLKHEMDLAMQDADSAAKTLRRFRDTMNEIQQGYESLVAELEYCPTCGQRLPEGGLDGGSTVG